MSLPILAGLVGLILGRDLAAWIASLTPTNNSPTDSAWTHIPLLGSLRLGRRDLLDGRQWLVELGTGVLFSAFAVAMLDFHCQQADSVRPDDVWLHGRVVYHLILISLLVVATGTDLREIVIPDQITFSGISIGATGAFISGDLQMMHLWVDWNHPFVELEGPFIPEWIKQHHHWHGLAWSLAGASAGAAITWIVRVVSRWLLGQHALGFGDVTLMAMVGSFIGWQPVVFVLLLAPPCGLLVGLCVRLLTGRSFIPYGPYLAAATVIVLFSWRWLWGFAIDWSDGQSFSVKRLFGDWPSLLIIAGSALVMLIVLLGVLRLYRAIPVTRRKPLDD